MSKDYYSMVFMDQTVGKMAQMVRNLYQNGKFGSKSGPSSQIVCQNRTMARTDRAKASVLDDISKEIIEQLQTDGRKPYSEIAKAVGLSEAAVRQRMQKLQETGVMQVVAVTDPLQLGFYRQAMIGIRCSGDMTGLANKLSAMPEADYVVMTAGSFDILVEVVVENDQDLIDVLNTKIRSLPEVISTETFVYLKLHKQFYNWGVR
jgi:Lrp/AsnC family transcriptional regulator for asnA, asnC and gidA